MSKLQNCAESEESEIVVGVGVYTWLNSWEVKVEAFRPQDNFPTVRIFLPSPTAHTLHTSTQFI